MVASGEGSELGKRKIVPVLAIELTANSQEKHKRKKARKSRAKKKIPVQTKTTIKKFEAEEKKIIESDSEESLVDLGGVDNGSGDYSPTLQPAADKPTRADVVDKPTSADDDIAIQQLKREKLLLQAEVERLRSTNLASSQMNPVVPPSAPSHMKEPNIMFDKEMTAFDMMSTQVIPSDGTTRCTSSGGNTMALAVMEQCYRDRIQSQVDIEIAESEYLSQLKARKRAEAQAKQMELSQIFSFARSFQQNY